MALSLIYGMAFEVRQDDPLRNHVSVREYREATGRVFIGESTEDIEHVCGRVCADAALAELDLLPANLGLGPVWDYVSLREETRTDGTGTGKFQTVDVTSFDPGDDPLVLCAACEEVLRRDNKAFEEQYGRPLDGKFAGEDV